MSLAVPRRLRTSGKVLLVGVVVSALAALITTVALPTSARIKNNAALPEVERTAAGWIELGLLSALACHGNPSLSDAGQPQFRR